MKIVAELTIEKKVSRSGKKYTAVFATFPDGDKIFISFDKKVAYEVLTRIRDNEEKEVK